MKVLALPPAVSVGDTISLVAPAGPIDPAALVRAIGVLEQRGLATKTYRDVTTQSGYLAGSDLARIDEFNAAIRDPETSAILPIRGGYGLARIVDRLDYATLARRPKLVCGFSDITVLHAAIQRHAALASFHGPNLQDGIGSPAGLRKEVAPAYWHSVMNEPVSTHQDEPLQGDVQTLCGGKAEGPLVGGNLTVLCGLIGTPYEPDTSGAILLLEDVGEALYRIDRMLAQLALAGKIQPLAGVVLGQFTSDVGQPPIPPDDLRQVFARFFGSLGVPVVANYPIGHTPTNLTVPLGVPVVLDGDAGRLDLEQARAQVTACRAQMPRAR